MDSHQFVQVGFSSAIPIYGVIVKGSSEIDAYVTSYYVMYSWDDVTYSYVEDSYGRPQVCTYGPVGYNQVELHFD